MGVRMRPGVIKCAAVATLFASVFGSAAQAQAQSAPEKLRAAYDQACGPTPAASAAICEAMKKELDAATAPPVDPASVEARKAALLHHLGKIKAGTPDFSRMDSKTAEFFRTWGGEAGSSL